MHSLSVRLWLGSVALILLTTLSAGAPAYWLTRLQLERQAWSQVENGRSATRSLLTAEEDRLRDHLLLFTERPTLRQLTRILAADELQRYLLDFQTQSGLDLLGFCTADGRAFGGADRPWTCSADGRERFTIWDGRPILLAQRAATDNSSGREFGTASVGIWLDDAFLQQLAAATGLRHSITRLDAGQAQDPAASRRVQTVDGRTYYAAYVPLPGVGDGPALFMEVALPVDGLVAAERRAFSILALSTVGIGLLGALFSIWFVQQVNAPLRRLTAAAEEIGRGGLLTPIPPFSAPAEVKTLSDALQRSQTSMLAALHESAAVGERLNTILQSLVEGVATCDDAGRIAFWSAGAQQLLEWTPAEAVGRTVDELFRPVAPTAEPLLRQLAPGAGRRQIAAQTRSGRPVVLAITGSPLPPTPGETKQTALVFRDITEEAAVLRMRSYFLANISHEFRTPLSTLIASMELLLDERETFTTAELRQLLRPSHLSLLSLQTLIDNLLESSSIEAGQFALRLRTFHIQEAIENAVKIARPLLERRNQTLSLEEPAHLPPIEGDATRLTQVLVNLIVNAAKYSPVGRPIELHLSQEGATLQLGVADRGPGIPAAERDALFRSFVRLNTGDSEQYGVGLGLFVVKTVIEAHDGRVGIEDHAGGGSVFWFEIPVRRVDQATPLVEPVETDAPATGSEDAG